MLLEFWQRLQKIHSLTLHAQAKNQAPWHGSGTVLISTETTSVLMCYEKGHWQPQNIAFTNTYRWTLDIQANQISLEHFHQGPNHPTFLFFLAPTGSQTLASVAPHLCKEDIYSANVQWDKEKIHLFWRVTGPKKDEIIDYTYIY